MSVVRYISGEESGGGPGVLDNMEHWKKNSASFQTKPQKWALVNCCLTFLYGTCRFLQSIK